MKTRQTSKHLFRGGVLAMTATSLFLLSSCSNQEGFQMADTDANGAVSPAEFERYMLEAIYAEADSDGNAQITFAEWQAANPDADKKKFSAPDTNRDQIVTPEEAKAHFKRQGTMKDLFSQIDTDGDGSLSLEEVTAYKEKLAALSGTPLQKLSKSVSADK